MGLETSKRGLFTQQTALYTTGNNISNANTLGYSRQRVNMESTAGYPGIGLNTGTMPGFLGTGVQAGSIQRIRDGFVDQQYRQESNKFGFWEAKAKAISQMEDVLSEPSAHGLQKSLSQFWQSLSDLATNPTESGASAVVVRRGEAVADSFNYMHKSLADIQANLGNEINISTQDINSMLQQISELNRQIAEVEPNGYLPNDLYDARDMLLDELAMYVPIETNYDKSGGRALAIAEGSVTVTLKMKEGLKIELVKGNQSATLETNPSSLVGNDKSNNPIEGMKITAADGTVHMPGHADFLDNGKLKSLMSSYGTDTGKVDAAGNKIIEGLYPDMIAELDKMVLAFTTKFNEVYASGFPKEGNIGVPTEFFVPKDPTSPLSAGNFKVNDLIVADPNLFRASTELDEEGNGKNAKLLADIQSSAIKGLGGSTLETYFQGVIGKLGVNGEQAVRNTDNAVTLLGAVEHRRASISAVSLDEEMTDMIRFQQAYNASARMITVVDETLDKIINGMGRVGM